jgi:WD40 repeat protein
MAVLATCFGCGKSVLVQEMQHGQATYCFVCRASRGIDDPETSASRSAASSEGIVKISSSRPAPAVKKSREDQSDKARRKTGSGEPSGSSRTGLIIGLTLGGAGLLALVIVGVILASKNDPPTEVTTRNPVNNPENWPQAPAFPEVQIPGRDPVLNPVGDPIVNPIRNPMPDPMPEPDPNPMSVEVPLRLTIPASTTGVWGVAFSPDGNTLASVSGYLGMPGQLRFWQTARGDAGSATANQGSDLFGVAYFPDGKRVALAGGNQGVQVFNIQGRPGATLRHPSYVRAVALAPDGNSLASSCEKKVIVWDVGTGKQRWSGNLLGGDLAAWRIPTRLAFSPDSETVAAGNGSRDVVVLDTATGQAKATCRGHQDTVVCTAFSPNGKYLVSGSFDSSIKVWNPNTGSEVKTLRGHKDWVFCVAVAPDNQTLASSCRDGAVSLWDIESGKRLATLKAHTKEAACVAFSPQGNLLVSSGVDGAVKIWEVSHIVKAP